MGRKHWKSSEDEFLKKYYGKLSCRQIADRLCCGSNAVRHRAKKLFLCREKKNLGNTLCWRCQKATGNCDWSRFFRPVKGWEAEETLIQNDQQKSYLVIRCPEFVKDIR